MCDSTLAIYCFIDDFLKASGHREDIRVAVTDAEVITIALTAMLQFGGNFERSRLVLHQLGLLVDNLGMAYGISGDLKKAKATFEYGLSKDPD